MPRSKTKTAKAEAEPIELRLFLPVAPAWKTQGEAVEYLGGRFADTLFGVRELLLTGTDVGEAASTLVHDLAIVAEALARSLETGAPAAVEVEAAPSNVADLASSVGALHAKVALDGIEVPCPGGITHDILSTSLRVLYDVVAAGARIAGEEHEERWCNSMDKRNRDIRAMASGGA